MKTLVSLLIVACLFNASASSYLGPEVGEPAPALKVRKWLQAPNKATAGWPSGKVVILEFWATWCSPCVGSIPHLNDLAEQFKDKPVQFIAVTDEKENVVQPFLKKTPITAWIGLTKDPIFGETNPYRVYGIPHTVIIDANGHIAAVIDPGALNSNLIELCLAGKPLEQVEGKSVAMVQNGLPKILEDTESCPPVGVVPGQSSIGKIPMFQAMIRPATPVSATKGQSTTHRWSSSELGLSLPDGQLDIAILSVFQIPRTRLVLEAALPKDSYDIYLSLPPRNIGQHGMMLETIFSQALQATFGLTVKRETRTVDVLVLRANATSTEKLARSTHDGKEELYGGNEITGINRSLASLAEGLENAAKKPVFDETGVTNLYSFHLKWDQKDGKHPNLEGMTATVQKLGLELTSEKRRLELVVVRGASE
jgi:uncharacterized protein (TIGR03435 family)